MLLSGVEISLIARLMHNPSLGLGRALAHRLMAGQGCAVSPSSKPVFNSFSLFGTAKPLSRLSPKSDLTDTAAIVGVRRARAQGSREGH